MWRSSSDGSFVVRVDPEQRVCLWENPNSKLATTVEGRQEIVASQCSENLDFSCGTVGIVDAKTADSGQQGSRRLVALGTTEGHVLVWDLDQNKEEKFLGLDGSGHKGSCRDVVIADAVVEGRLRTCVLSIGEDNKLRRWFLDGEDSFKTETAMRHTEAFCMSEVQRSNHNNNDDGDDNEDQTTPTGLVVVVGIGKIRLVSINTLQPLITYNLGASAPLSVKAKLYGNVVKVTASYCGEWDVRVVSFFLKEGEVKRKQTQVQVLSVADEVTNINVDFGFVDSNIVCLSCATTPKRTFVHAHNVEGERWYQKKGTVDLKENAVLHTMLNSNDLTVVYGDPDTPTFQTVVVGKNKMVLAPAKKRGREEESAGFHLNASKYVTLDATLLAPTNKKPKKDERASVPLQEAVKQMEAMAAPERKLVHRGQSLAAALVQGIHSGDNTLLESALRAAGNFSTVESTVKELPTAIVVPLLECIVQRISTRPGRTAELLAWVSCALRHHTAFLVSLSELPLCLQQFRQLISSRVAPLDSLVALHARVGLVTSQPTTKSVQESATKYLKVYQERGVRNGVQEEDDEDDDEDDSNDDSNDDSSDDDNSDDDSGDDDSSGDNDSGEDNMENKSDSE